MIWFRKIRYHLLWWGYRLGVCQLPLRELLAYEQPMTEIPDDYPRYVDFKKEAE